MSAYPMTVHTESLDHSGGSKSFHLMQIDANDGRSVFVSRWGKTGAFGQFKVERFENRPEARRAWDKKRNEKRGGGYRPGATNMVVAENEADLRRILGVGYLSTFGPDNLRHLDPHFNVTGVRGAKVDYDENGEKVDTAKRVDPRLLREAAERERQEKEAQAAAQRAATYNDDPLFGLF